MWRRLLSYIWPVPVVRVDGQHGPLEVRWEYGVKVLNSGQANQSFGSLHRVWQVVFARTGIAHRPPGSVLVLGLGAGSVPRILQRELGISAPIKAIELDPMMLELARSHFELGSINGLEVLPGDATILVHALPERHDLVVVDLFDELDLARGTDSSAFAHGLRDRCAEGGMVMFNTVAHGEASTLRCDRVLGHLRRVFHAVDEIQVEGINRVFVARG